jgi:hypothetical protein
MAQIGNASLIERRAQALATVLLTGRADLMTMDVPDWTGVDVLASIIKDGATTLNQFGVILKATTTLIQSPRAASRALNARMVEVVHTTIPVCIFFFNMTGNRGFYAWLYEPMVIDGVPKLRHRSPLVCGDLNEEALGEIVDRVNAYYNALSKALAG